ncbi:MAG TPA: M10 family metallopeptidase C-terminal domain-containing protein [Rhizomicrobium sp.]|nr:M10 family metallopeptidase C-terminal domain-containing protein [Rhizomicrobium sp.]
MRSGARSYLNPSIAVPETAASFSFSWEKDSLPHSGAGFGYATDLFQFAPATNPAATAFNANPDASAGKFLDFGQAAAAQHASPTMAQEVAFISGVNANGTVAATSFATWNGNNPATYGGFAGVAKFGSPAAETKGGTVKYYFETASHWTAGEKAVLSDCLKLWSDLADVKFVVTHNASAAQISFHRGNDGEAFTQPSYTGASGAGAIGGTKLNTMTHATISLDTSVPGFGPIDGNFGTIGGYVFETILHEEGHALGLGHAGAYNGDDNPKTQQFSAYDSRLWAIMSYIEPTENAKYSSQYPVKGANWGISADGYGNDPTTPMALDIQAIQSLYGAPTSTAFSGGQTFGFHCNIADATKEFYDFTVNTNPVVTIWDAGEHNKLDLSGFSSASKVNLQPGSFSSCDGKAHNIGIAFGTAINSAITGDGNDHLVGNSARNVLKGGAGQDHLVGGAGADRLFGGNGADVFVYHKASDSTGSKFDKIAGFDGSADKLDLWFAVKGPVETFHPGSVSKGSMNGDLAHFFELDRLGAHHAALVTPRHGDEAGHTFLVVDANGQAGYQANADLVIEVTGGINLHHLDASSFI